MKDFFGVLCLFLLAASGSLAAEPPNMVASGHAARLKLVSFAPSNTELLFSIGAADDLVGVCNCCDFPPQVHQLETVGSFSSANLERLARLKPNDVLMVSGQEQLSGQVAHNGFKVRVLNNNRLTDIANNLRTLGEITGRRQQADNLAQSFDQSMQALNDIIAQAKTRPRVFYCVWPQPLLTVGEASFLNDVITTCGGENIASTLTAAYPHFSTEKLVLSNPDMIVLPYEAKQQKFLQYPPWSSLKAVKNGAVIYMPQPKSDGLARPTLRIVTGLLWLSQKLHPELASNLKDWSDQASRRLHLN